MGGRTDRQGPFDPGRKQMMSVGSVDGSLLFQKVVSFFFFARISIFRHRLGLFRSAFCPCAYSRMALRFFIPARSFLILGTIRPDSTLAHF